VCVCGWGGGGQTYQCELLSGQSRCASLVSPTTPYRKKQSSALQTIASSPKIPCSRASFSTTVHTCATHPPIAPQSGRDHRQGGGGQTHLRAHVATGSPKLLSELGDGVPTPRPQVGQRGGANWRQKAFRPHGLHIGATPPALVGDSRPATAAATALAHLRFWQTLKEPPLYSCRFLYL